MYWVKRVLIALGVLALLAGAVLAALLVLVNPNDYKSVLQDAVQQRFNRKLDIDGDIQLSVIPRLGLEVSGVSLSEPNSSQVFAAVDTARVAVAWWPLLSRHLVVEHLAVSGVKANVVRDANGRFNFHDLLHSQDAQAPGAPPASTDEQAPEQPSVQLDVGGVTLDDGEIAFRDEGNDMAVRMGRLTLSASDISFGRPFDFTLSGRILGQSPRADATVQVQGAMMLDPYAERYAVRNLDLRVVGVLPSVRANTFAVRGDAAFDAALAAIDVSGLTVAFQGDIALATPLTGVEAQISAPKLAANLRKDELTLEKIGIKATGRMDSMPFAFALDAPGLQISDSAATGGAVKMSFTREGRQPLSARLAISEVAGNAERFEVASMSLQAQFRQGDRSTDLTVTSPLAGSLKKETLELPGLSATVKITDPALPDGRLEIPATGRLNVDFAGQKASAAIQATIEGGNFDTSADVAGFTKPALRFKLAADRLDLDKLWPARPAAAPANPAPAAKGAEGRVDTPVDLSALNDIDAKGTIRIGELMARGLHAREVGATLSIAKGRAQVSDLAAKIYEGSLAGQAFADAGSNQLGVKARFTDVAVQPLLNAIAQYDALSGKGNVALDLVSAGKTTDALRRGLNGSVDVNLRDGQFRGINVAQSLRDFKAMLGRGENTEANADAERVTDFSELRATLNLQQGVGSVKPLLVAAPLLRITEGQPNTVNLADQVFDLVMNAKVVNTATGQDGKALEELRDITIPVHVSGPLNAPKYAVLWRQVGSQALEHTLKNEARRQLDRLLNRKEGEATDGAPAPAASENPTGKILGEALKGLFNQ